MRPTMLLFAAAVTTIASAQQPTDTTPVQKQVIQLPGSLPGLPFSSAVRVGNVLYLSGQIGVFPGTRRLVDTGIVKQTQTDERRLHDVLSQGPAGALDGCGQRPRARRARGD